MINWNLGKLERLFSNQRHFSPFSTLYLNFRTLPIREALKLPIYVYGPVEFVCLRGKIKFEVNRITSGMVKLGRHRDDYTLSQKSKICLLKNESTICFRGVCSIGENFLIRVVEKGRLVFNGLTWIGSSVSFFALIRLRLAT